MIKALIHDNKVVELSDYEFDVHESLSWIDVDSTVQVGWELENGIPVNPDKRTEAEKVADALAYLRKVRNAKLTATDWWAVSDREMTQAQKDYRQALRDITDNYNSVLDVVWPMMPV